MRSRPSRPLPHRMATISPYPKQKYSRARIFCITVFTISILSLYSLAISWHEPALNSGSQSLLQRDIGDVAQGYTSLDVRLSKRDEECRLVHNVEDKCAFIRANCPDEEAGLFSYLQLYYCRLDKAKPVAFIILIIWLGFLFSTIGIAASDFFCINLSTVASILGMSESMAGVTFLALGNGSPDVFSTFAAMKSHSGSLAIGELIGAAGFITAVVAGSMALVRPFKVARKSFVRDRRRLQEQESAARAHFHIPDTDEVENQQYHDEDEDLETGSSRRQSRGVSTDDFAALERGNSPLLQAMGEEADEETRGHWMAEISNNMRVSRPTRGERRNTANPIRPSLVGALEFRAVLSSLEKSRNIQTIPLNSRRYSDDPTYTTAQQQDQASTISNPEISYEYVDVNDLVSDGNQRTSVQENQGTIPARVRAVSANDAAGLKLDTDVFSRENDGRPRPTERLTSSQNHGFGYMSTSPPPMSRRLETKPSSSLLAPPGENIPPSSERSPQEIAQDQQSTLITPDTPRLNEARSVPRIQVPHSPSTQWSSPVSPFPEYHDDPNYSLRSRPSSIRLPPPSIGSESTYLQRVTENATGEKPVRWWPYKVLPPPKVLVSTLFPTLYSWRDKSPWEKLLGVIAAPSVLVLVITLPIVEAEKDDHIPDAVDPDPGLLSPGHLHSNSQSLAVLAPDSPAIAINGQINKPDRRPANSSSHRDHEHSSTLINIADLRPSPNLENGRPKIDPASIRQNSATILPEARLEFTTAAPSSAKDWNRWLVATQIFTAPLFIVLLVWGNTDPRLELRNLLLPVLYSLIASLVAFAILIVTTIPSRPPTYRYLFCFFGFVVSIAWISSIANEVVGVLKAFGVILGISDAILGLTIFAVGSSLGDLVADITVARLGFPVMALSACFGGPMLNILLGIGISGLYMTVREGRHKHEKHPNRPIQYKPYQIEVSPTLMISGVTLLVTLLGLLVVVPLNKWRMDRRIGWGLVALWCATTLGNVIVEVMGLGW
ncbi:MAG: hypothetical protein Q9214_003173 [Letrouitia sp. 1 TL-2023]